MAFSGALTLTDLNDFITPSQACIKPVEQIDGPKSQEKEPGAASTEIVIDSSGAYYEVVSGEGPPSPSTTMNGQTKKLRQAQISLNDCLACSGCITSAESVLITLQSHTEVIDFLKENKTSSNPKIPVISIAPQSLASLAASISTSVNVTPLQVLRRLRPFLKSTVGFSHVFDTTFARHLALNEHLTEYLERKAKDSPAPPIIINGRGDKGVNGRGQQGTVNGTRQGQSNSQECQLPMLASACPGWICYAEKAHSEMLPFISRTKSPQQVMGTLVKEWMGRKWKRTPDGVYHVTVMPCYDKKLEASRQDFYNDIYSTRDVDCVITTGELELIMMEHGWDLGKEVPGELEVRPAVNDFGGEVQLPELIQHTGTSSGSYLHSIILHLQHTSTVPLTLAVKMIRNSDYEEYTLTEDGDAGKVVFKGAKCFGFRNLQNIVRKVGKAQGVRTGTGAAGKLAGRRRITNGVGSEDRGKNYDYVEVMACPGGCVNGGGQLKPRLERMMKTTKDEEGYERNWEEIGVIQNAKWGDREWTRLVEEAYWRSTRSEGAALNSKQDMAEADILVDRVTEELCDGDPELRRPKLRTLYRAVESEVLGLAVKW